MVEPSDEHLEHDVPDGDARLGELLTRRGWIAARRFWRMRIDFDGPVPEPVWPDGVQVQEQFTRYDWR